MNVDLALRVAHAALMEVGQEPWQITTRYDEMRCCEVLSSCDIGGPPSRAALLGIMAAEGPNYIVRCDVCRLNEGLGGTSLIPCTPVRDAIRGVTCEVAQ